MVVPQFRDGECEVRRLLGRSRSRRDGLGRLRNWLSCANCCINEPHVRGLGYGQYADEVEE